MEISFVIMLISIIGLTTSIFASNNLNASNNKNLHRKIKHLQRKNNGGNEMSKIINDLVGKKCRIISSESISPRTGIINSADDDWVNFSYEKKKEIVTSIIRVDSIRSVDIIE